MYIQNHLAFGKCKDTESICIVYLFDERRKCFVVFQFVEKQAFDSIRHVLLFTFHCVLFFLSLSPFRFLLCVSFFSFKINRR